MRVFKLTAKHTVGHTYIKLSVNINIHLSAFGVRSLDEDAKYVRPDLPVPCTLAVYNYKVNGLNPGESSESKMTAAEAIETSITNSLSQDYTNLDDLPPPPPPTCAANDCSFRCIRFTHMSKKEVLKYSPANRRQEL